MIKKMKMQPVFKRITTHSLRSLLVRYKEAKYEIKMLNCELTEAYTKIKFLELEVVQVNIKIERVSTKKLDDVFSHQKHFFEKTGLGYTGESSSVMNISKSEAYEGQRASCSCPYCGEGKG